MSLHLIKYALILGAGFEIFQVQSMETASKDPNPKISLSIRANYSDANKRYISDAVKDGLVSAQEYISDEKKPWHFTALMEKPHNLTGQMTLPNYHVSLAVIEHAQNTDVSSKSVGAKHVECLTNLWRENIKSDDQYAGQSYAIHMYVHGYDGKGQEIHQHYALPTDHVGEDEGLLVLDPRTMVKDLGTRFTGGVSHLHYVLAYESNDYMPTQRQRPDIIKNVGNLMMAVKRKSNDKNCPMKDIYEGKHAGFNAYTTIGVLKQVQGPVTSDSPRFSREDHGDIVYIYKIIKDEFKKNKLTNISFDHFSLNGMTAKGKQVTVVESLK